nr:GspL/Epsl periplasmic domain-containing protein [Pseudomonas aeruginosa]
MALRSPGAGRDAGRSAALERARQLDYHAGELDLELLPGPPGGDAAAWQGELGKHGLQADASDKGWQVRAMEAPPAPAAGAADSGTAEAAADEDE